MAIIAGAHRSAESPPRCITCWNGSGGTMMHSLTHLRAQHIAMLTDNPA